jgi:hypothetical protein
MKGKCVVEFGVRGGNHCDNFVLPTYALGEELATKLVFVLSENPDNTPKSEFFNLKTSPRMSWTSSTHYVSLSRLDGVPRGPATPDLWRKG